MKNFHIAQDVTASFWNAATVLLTPLTSPRQRTMFSYPVVHPASSLPSAFPFALPSSAASPSIHLGTEDVIQLTETRRFIAFLSSAKLDDLLISLSLQSQNLGNHLFSPPHFT